MSNQFNFFSLATHLLFTLCTTVIVFMSLAVTAYVAMVALMTSVPLTMQYEGFTFDESSHVIQAHVLGMFVPSILTGTLVKKFGSSVMTLVGIVIFASGVGLYFIGKQANFLL